jgi:tetratricopeptide (TPR) repeat protein
LIGGGLVLVLLAASLGPTVGRRAWRQFSHPAAVTSSNPTARLTQLSGTRYDLWSVAVKGFKARPISGTGAGTYGFWWNRHARTLESVRNAHSLELENMAELGAPGLVLIVGVLVAAMLTVLAARRKSRRRASAGAATALLAALAVYLLQASVDWMWQSTAVTVLALAGAAVAGVRASGRRRVWRWPLRAAGVLVALGALLVHVPGLASTAEIRRSQAAERAGNGPLALAWANAATHAEPWSASAYEQRALVLEAGGHLRASARDLRRAVDHERTNYLHWLLLARVETELGQFAVAQRDYAQARALRTKALVFLDPGALPGRARTPNHRARNPATARSG